MPGGPISLLNSFNFYNFVWTLQLAGASADKVAVPAIVGEQVAATA